jgi:WD40 repeat protein
MTYCLNPLCPYPENTDEISQCLGCGAKLLLRERYRPIRPIGKGGFGRTFLALDEDKPSKPPCVIKQFLPQNTNNPHKAIELFNQEAVRLDQLGQHPQIPDLFAHFQQENYQYLVQEYIDGPNLAEELKEKSFFAQGEIKQLLLDLLPVLEFIHLHQVIHRDIKPDNIIRRKGVKSVNSLTGAFNIANVNINPNNNGQLVLVDFGAAKVLDDGSLLQPGTIIGSPEYVAPEQTRGRATFASDIYSLGVTCLHLLTNISPFQLYDIGQDAWVWRDYLKQPINSLLSRILDKMVHTNLLQRYQSPSEVLKELNPQAISLNTPNSPVYPFHTTETNTTRPTPIPSEEVYQADVPTMLPPPVYPGHHPNTPSMPAPTTTPPNFPSRSNSPQPVSGTKPAYKSTGSSLFTPHVGEFIQQPKSLLESKFMLKGHTDTVTSVAFSLDGQILASGSRDHTIEIWDLQKGKRWFTLTGHNDGINAIALSHDGQMLASGSRDQTVEVWDLQKGKRWFTLTGHQDWVNAVAFSPNGQIIASGGRDQTIEMWSVEKAKLAFSLPGHQDGVNTLAFSPDGQVLVSGSRDKTIKLWDVTLQKELTTLTEHQDWVRAIAFHPQENLFASASRDGTVKLWQIGLNLSRVTLFRTLQVKQGDISSVAFSHDGETLAGGDRQGKIYLWSVKTGELLSVTPAHSGDVLSLAYSPEYLASGSSDMIVQVWQKTTNNYLL